MGQTSYPLIIVDEKGLIQHINDRACSLLNMAEKEGRGQHWQDFMSRLQAQHEVMMIQERSFSKKDRDSIEEEMQVTMAIMGELDNAHNLSLAYHNVLNILSNVKECKAVGLWLKEKGRESYFFSRGMPREMSPREGYTCDVQRQTKEKTKNHQGCMSPSCYCGELIMGEEGRHSFEDKKSDFGSILISDLSQETSIENKEDLACYKAGFETMALIPIWDGDTVLGVLQLFDARSETLRPEDLPFLELISRHIADSYRHVRDDVQMQRRLDLERAVAEVANVLLTKKDGDTGHILSILGKAIAVEKACFYRYQNGEITLEQSWCNKEIHGSCVGQSPGHSFYPILEKLQNRDTLMIQDTSEEGLIQNILRRGGARAVLIIPVYTREEFNGFMVFANYSNPRFWWDEDVRLLQAAAEILAATIQQKEAEKRIHYLTFHDNLTGLYNRTFFEQEFQRLDSPRQLPLTIIMGDVNGLKLVNDTFGHAQGDLLLEKAARIFKASCRQEDIIARWGGDEFIILLPQTDEGTAQEIIQRINRATRREEEAPIPLSIALGSATKVEENQDIASVLKQAEDEMYKNKLMEGRSTRSSILNYLETAMYKKGISSDGVERMQELALLFGKYLGLETSDIEDGLLLLNIIDIGKIALPEDVLMQEERLSHNDQKELKKHPEIGYRIAKNLPELASIAESILTHHEQWNGQGYPNGLKGKGIPFLARLVAMIEGYVEAHQEGLDGEQFLHDEAGVRFDPDLVQSFLNFLRENQI